MADDKNGLSKFKGLYVELRKDGDPVKNLDDALKKLKRLSKRSNLMLILNQKSHFIKPSAKRRDEKSKAKARARSQTRKNSL